MSIRTSIASRHYVALTMLWVLPLTRRTVCSHRDVRVGRAYHTDLPFSAILLYFATINMSRYIERKDDSSKKITFFHARLGLTL